MWHESAETFEHEQNRNTAETGADKLQLIHFLLKWADVRLESQHIALWLLVWYQTNTKYDRGVNPRWDDMKEKVQIHPLMSRIYKLYSIQMWAVLNANRNQNRRRNDISVGIRLNKNFFKKYLLSSNTENPKASVHAISAFELTMPDFWVLLYKTISSRLVLKIHQNAED